MSTTQKVCPLCCGHGRFDDIECLLCDRSGFIVVDEIDAPARPSSGRVSRGPGAARAVGVGTAAAPRGAVPAPTENDLQAAWLDGYVTARGERRVGANAAGYAVGVAHVAALHLEQRGRRAAAAATLVAFVVGIAAAPTVYALLAEATR